MDPAPTLLVGEPLALDFVNTRTLQPAGLELDFLTSTESVRLWLAAESDRLDPPGRGVDLAAVRALRDHVEAAVHAARQGRKPPVVALRAITAAQRAAAPYRVLAWDGTSVTAEWERAADGTTSFLAELAESATDLITDPTVTSVRQCEGPSCRMLFLPAHPRRRWCSPALCGNRVRVARYYRRHRYQVED